MFPPRSSGRIDRAPAVIKTNVVLLPGRETSEHCNGHQLVAWAHLVRRNRLLLAPQTTFLHSHPTLAHPTLDPHAMPPRLFPLSGNAPFR